MSEVAHDTLIIRELSPPDGTPEAELISKYPKVWDLFADITVPEREKIILASVSAQTEAEAMRLAVLGIGVLNSVEQRLNQGLGRVTHINSSRSTRVTSRSASAAG